MSENFNQQRRQFLTGGILNRNGNSQPDEARGQEQLQSRAASHLERYSKPAMACEFELLLNLHQYASAAEAALGAFQLIDSIEDQMSIYRDGSELSRVNREAARQFTSITPQLFEILRLSEQIFTSTSGAFDVTATPLSKTWGLHRRNQTIPNDSEISEALTKVGMQHVDLSEQDPQVMFRIDDLMIDLGGIGKGFAIDLATNLLQQQGIHDFVLQGGQSSVAAIGKNIDADTRDDSGWKIGLSHPSTPNCRIAEFELVDQKLGTSGTQRQGFFYAGRRFGHIIDPRTGYPTDHCLSSTVICDRAAVADALATAFFVMCLDEVQAFCDKNLDVAAVLVYPNNKTGVKLETFNCQNLRWKSLL